MTGNGDEKPIYRARKHPRFSGDGDFVLLKLKKGNSPDDEIDPDAPAVYARVINISEGGLRIDIPLENQPLFEEYGWPPKLSDIVDLILTGPTLPMPIRVEGRIVNIDAEDFLDSHRISLEFINLGEHVKQMIQVSLVRLQLAIRSAVGD